MNQNKLDGITVFALVVEKGGFTAAARQLGHSASYISKEVTKLENRLGARLLNRTTRTISLTDIGKIYYDRCKQIINDAEEAEDSVSQLHHRPRGLLRVSAPVTFGLGYLRAEVPDFLKIYPELNLEIEFNDRLVDVVAEGFDVVIRVSDLKDSNLVTRRITTSRLITVASRGYWRQHGRPSHPTQLSQRDCIVYSYNQPPDYWEYSSPGQKTIGVKLKPRAQCNSAELQTAMAVEGLGVTRLPAFACAQELADGRLEIVLEEYELPPLGVYAVYPHRQHLSAKVQAFVDFVTAKFGNVNNG